MSSPLDSGTKTDIRWKMGWPQRYRQSDSLLEQALNYLDTDDDMQAIVTGSILPAIEDIDCKLKTAQLNLQAAKVGEIETRLQEISWLRSEGRRWTGRLASLLAVPLQHDYFGSDSSDVSNPGRNGIGGRGHVRIG